MQKRRLVYVQLQMPQMQANLDGGGQVPFMWILLSLQNGGGSVDGVKVKGVGIKRKHNTYYSKRGCYRYKQHELKMINLLLQRGLSVWEAIEYLKEEWPNLKVRLGWRVRYVDPSTLE
jgi:hypothetical protein